MTVVRTRILGIVCLCLVIGLLVFGLWPFHHPKNQVSWISGGDGLRLGRRATIVSDGPLKIGSSGPNRACSVEVWLQPNRENDSGTIVAFYDSSTGQVFSIRQELTDLVLQTDRRGQLGERENVNRIFRTATPVFLTIASGDQGTAVYMNGRFVQMLRDFRFTSDDLSRQLILGDSPFQPDGWSGKFFGLALYRTALSSTQAHRHYECRMQAGRLDGNDEAKEEDGLAALYPFSERSGDVARSAHSTAVELRIPERYSILDKTLLEAPWKAYRPTLDYWNDVAVNVLGFVPFGLFAAAFFSAIAPKHWPSGRAMFVAIAAGWAISLTIETMQVFLPTRDSDMTDVITNTIGTCIGVALFRLHAARYAIDRFLDVGEFAIQRVGMRRRT